MYYDGDEGQEEDEDDQDECKVEDHADDCEGEETGSAFVRPVGNILLINLSVYHLGVECKLAIAHADEAPPDREDYHRDIGGIDKYSYSVGAPSCHLLEGEE